jgi:hypothetical protein
MQKMISLFSKERFDLVALSLPSLNSHSILDSQVLIDSELGSYL